MGVSISRNPSTHAHSFSDTTAMFNILGHLTTLGMTMMDGSRDGSWHRPCVDLQVTFELCLDWEPTPQLVPEARMARFRVHRC